MNAPVVSSRDIIIKTLENEYIDFGDLKIGDVADKIIQALAKEHLHIFKGKGVEL